MFNLPAGSSNVSVPPNGWHWGGASREQQTLEPSRKRVVPRNVFNREELFTIARAGQGSGKYSISFPLQKEEGVFLNNTLPSRGEHQPRDGGW